MHIWYHPLRSCGSKPLQSKLLNVPNENKRNQGEHQVQHTPALQPSLRMRISRTSPGSSRSEVAGCGRKSFESIQWQERRKTGQIDNKFHPSRQTFSLSSLRLRHASGTSASSEWWSESQLQCGGAPSRCQAGQRRASKWQTGTRRPRRPSTSRSCSHGDRCYSSRRCFRSCHEASPPAGRRRRTRRKI